MTAGTDSPATEPAGSNRARACRRVDRPRTSIRGSDAVAAASEVSTSALEYDLLMLGYLSAVARELERRRVAESRLRIPTRREGAGALDLEPISGCADREPVRMTWDAGSGWCVLLRDGAGRPLIRRHLHPVVPEPARVAEFVAAAAAGAVDGAVGVRPPSPEGPDEDGASRERILVALARFALPEIRRWLNARHDPDADGNTAAETM